MGVFGSNNGRGCVVLMNRFDVLVQVGGAVLCYLNKRLSLQLRKTTTWKIMEEVDGKVSTDEGMPTKWKSRCAKTMIRRTIKI